MPCSEPVRVCGQGLDPTRRRLAHGRTLIGHVSEAGGWPATGPGVSLIRDDIARLFAAHFLSLLFNLSALVGTTLPVLYGVPA